MMKKWRYFGRTGGGPTIFEIYRVPDNGKSFEEQDRSKYPERLYRDGKWRCGPNDGIVWSERLVGNFDEVIDEITAEEVDQLRNEWSESKWPGR